MEHIAMHAISVIKPVRPLFVSESKQKLVDWNKHSDHLNRSRYVSNKPKAKLSLYTIYCAQ
jgi:hypothetical protein